MPVTLYPLSVRTQFTWREVSAGYASFALIPPPPSPCERSSPGIKGEKLHVVFKPLSVQLKVVWEKGLG